MPNNVEDATAKCPYYQSFVSRRITCERCVSRAKLILQFHSRAEAEVHKRLFCDTYDWGECGYARLISTNDGDGDR